jgi:hypothetical protein
VQAVLLGIDAGYPGSTPAKLVAEFPLTLVADYLKYEDRTTPITGVTTWVRLRAAMAAAKLCRAERMGEAAAVRRAHTLRCTPQRTPRRAIHHPPRQALQHAVRQTSRRTLRGTPQPPTGTSPRGAHCGAHRGAHCGDHCGDH